MRGRGGVLCAPVSTVLRSVFRFPGEVGPSAGVRSPYKPAAAARRLRCPARVPPLLVRNGANTCFGVVLRLGVGGEGLFRFGEQESGKKSMCRGLLVVRVFAMFVFQENRIHIWIKYK